MDAALDIKKDLIDQLDRNGMHGKHYVDMVNKYMEFWELHNKLLYTVETQGEIVPTGTGFKLNPAIEALNKNNTQMLRIISTLGLKEPPVPKEAETDDEDL